MAQEPHIVVEHPAKHSDVHLDMPSVGQQNMLDILANSHELLQCLCKGRELIDYSMVWILFRLIVKPQIQEEQTVAFLAT